MSDSNETGYDEPSRVTPTADEPTADGPTDCGRLADGACCGPADRATAGPEGTETADGGRETETRPGPNEGEPDRWRPDDGVLETPLPPALRAALGEFVGREAVETLDEWADIVRRHTAGDEIRVDDLCHAPVATGHWGELDGERYDFLCFYDAVVLAALAEKPVDIHTESPDGTVIEARAVGAEDLLVMPATAVFSFGVATDPPGDGDPSVEDFYAAGCPYVTAFPDREAYERWAETVPAHTVAMPLAGATELAAALVD